jgi:hypothetical protein
MRLGHLNIIHGHEIRVSGGAVNIARLLLIKSFDNILASNYHVAQEDTKKTINDKIKGAWDVGCLCGLKPQWIPVNNWMHGFAIIKSYQDGSFEVLNKKIINGMVR